MRLRFAALFASVLGIVFFATVGSAQVQNGSIVGNITDATGAAIPGVQLTLTETQKGLHWNTTSNTGGYYVFSDIPDGTYEVTATKPGFKTTTQSNVVLTINTTQRVNVMLPVGAAQQEVTVTAAPPLLQTDSADTHRLITSTEVQNLPMGGTRNFQQLFALIPGAATPYRAHSDFFNPQATLDVHMNGQTNPSDNLMIEGLTDNERTGLLQIYVPPADAIQEVNVSTSDYDAEFGAAGGYVGNVILKSGTNSLHGSAYEFTRSSTFGSANGYCSRPPCLTSPSPYHFNQFGGSIGGPIKHDKLFFFGDWETTIEHLSSFVKATVPDDKFRNGDFSEALDSKLTGYYDSKKNPVPDEIFNPFTSTDPNGNNRQVFSGNIIPQSLLQSLPAYPIIQKLVQLWPEPNLPGIVNNYQALAPGIRDNNQFDIKLDGQFRPTDHASYRFSWMRPKTIENGVFGLYGGNNVVGNNFDATGTDTTYQSGVDWTHTVSPTMLTELRFGVSRYRNVANPADYGQNTADQLGIRGINIQPFNSGMPTIAPHGGTSSLGFSASLPWIRTETDFDVVNNWTFIKGNHTIKLGADMSRLRDDLLQDQSYGPRGDYEFNSSGTALAGSSPIDSVSQGGIANGFASLLLDWPGSVGRDLPGIFPTVRQLRFFSYIGDKWQVTRSLTLDLGVRDELYEPIKPHFPGGLSNYDPTTNTLQLAGIGNVPMGLGVKTSYRNIDPRLGIAYRLSSTSVIRAGFGTSTIPFYDNHYAFNYPVRLNNFYQGPINSSYQQAVDLSGNPVDLATGMPAATIVPFPPSGILYAGGPKGTPQASLLSQQYTPVPLNLREGYLESWNLAFQQELPAHFTLDLAYVGNRAVDLLYHWDINAAPSPTCVIGGKTTKGNVCRPLAIKFGNQTGMDGFIPLGDNYNALQGKLTRQFASGLTSTASFTWAKAFDYGDGDDMPGLMDNVHFWRDRARAGFDSKLRLTEDFVYALPFGEHGRWAQSGAARALFGGWQFNGILTAYSGKPFTITSSNNTLNWPGIGTQTADQIGPYIVTHEVGGGVPGAATWIADPSASFTKEKSSFVIGTSGRNEFTGPGFFNLDFSLFRDFKVTERVNTQFRAESFNATNTPSWCNPDGSVDSSTFGQVTGTCNKGPRSFQFGLRVLF